MFKALARFTISVSICDHINLSAIIRRGSTFHAFVPEVQPFFEVSKR